MVPASTPRGSGSPRARRPPPERRLEMAVSWADVADTVRAIVATAPDEGTGHRLALGLTQPLAVLQELVDLAARADHDDDARAELRRRIAQLSAVAAAGPSREAPDPAGCCHGCGCGHAAGCGLHCRDGCHAGSGRDVAEDADGAEPGGGESATLDEQGLVVFAQLMLRALADAPRAEREAAIDTVTALVLSATPLAAVVEGWRRDGTDGVTTRIADLARTGLLDWVRPPQPMQVRSGGAPMGMPGLAGGGLPGVPGGGLPGLPGGGLPGLPGGRRPTIEDLLGTLKKPPKVWDPDDWCPVFVIGPRLDFIDPRPIARIRCLLAVLRILRDRAALLPPPRPARVVWSDGITGLEAAGACAGDTLTVVGHGFPNRNQAVLLLPFADGCRPVNVTAADWSNRRITVTLPAGIVSGPVGFADRAYVEAYDAWVAEQNRLADLANGYRCYAAVAWLPGFRECPPETPVNHLRAGQPIIEAFTANGAVDAVITTGQGITLAWTVRNAEQVRLARVSAAGPLFGSATSVTDPAGTTWWFGPQSVSAPTTYTYRLTVTGPCGTVTRDVRVAVSKRPALRIESVEVTQSIQTIPHSTRLVRWKPTVVRVTVRHGLAGFGGNVVPNVRGRIQVRPATGQWSPWFDAANGTSPMAPSPGSSITVKAAPQRNTTDDTLNFLLPPGWNAGTVSYRIEVRVAGYGASTFFAGFDEQTSMTTGGFTFEPRRMLDLRYVRVNWNGNTPTDATCQATLRSAIPLLPTPTASVTALAGVGVQSGSSLDDRDDLLDDFDDRHNCSLWEALTEWLGSDCPDDDGAIWVLIPGVFVRGRAYDIPSNVCFTPPNDGPYAAHELAHCLDQEHVSVMCSNGQQATGGDAPGDWPNNAQLVDVPFDVTRNAALSLAGTGVFDVMSYCGTPNNTWPMPIRYARLWDQVGG